MNPPSGTQSHASGRLSASILGGAFIAIGLAAILIFINSVLTDSAIRAVIDWVPTEDSTTQPSLLLVFLDNFGIVIPFLTFTLGGLSVWLGIRLFSRDIIAARWAQTSLMWLAIGSGLVSLFNLLSVIQLAASPEQPFDPNAALPLIATLLMIVPFALGYFWLSRNIQRVFYGREQLTSGQTRLAWNLLLPTMIVFVLVAARPLEQTFIRSLTDKRFAGQQIPNMVGLENYQNLLGIRFDTVSCRIDEETGTCETRSDGSVRWESIDRELLREGYRTAVNIRLPFTEPARSLAISGLDDDFISSIWTTLVFTVFSVSLELTIGLFMAMTVNSDFKGRGIMRAVMLIPWAIPTVISARLWELMLKDTSAGIVNRIMMDLNMIDMPQAWLSDASLQLPAAIMVDVWKTAPFMALLLLAGLQTIPKDLYEAASVDGASKLRQFFSITLPLLRPTIGVALVFRTLDALRVFDLFNVLFGRQQLTMATYNYETLVNNQQDGYASAISMVIFVLISIFAVIYVRLLNVETD